MYWILAIVFLTIIVYFRVIKPLQFFYQRCVPQRSVFVEILDTIRAILQLKVQADLVKGFYDAFPNCRYSGAYNALTPVMLLRDPELIKQITVKDFDHFADHSMFVSEEIDPLWGKNLFALKGDRWRDMRATLSPSFTSSKMKGMFIFINECAQQFVEYFKKHQITEAIDMQDALTRFANDVIASAAFGIQCDSLTYRDNEFYRMGKEASIFRGFWANLKIFFLFLFPTISGMLGIKLFNDRVGNFFRDVVKTNIESREKNGIVRLDMIHLLMEAKNGRLKYDDPKDVADSGFAVIEESAIGKDEKRQKRQLTNDDLTAQALIFFFAGFDSVSTLMCFLLYELAVNTDIQDTLRNEIEETLQDCKGTITYEALLKMKYLDMVISETMRKWPVQVAVDRLCVKPYTIKPTRDGEVPVHIQKDDNIWLPIYGLHRDPEFYPDPERFDPERFSDENKANINPYAYLPFGSGPRSCIGNRFALLETKLVIFKILSTFEVCISEKTRVPLKLAKDSFSLVSEDGYWFKLKPLVK